MSPTLSMTNSLAARLLALATSAVPVSAQCWEQHLIAGHTDMTLPSSVATAPGVVAFGKPQRNTPGFPTHRSEVHVFEGPTGNMNEVATLASTLASPSAPSSYGQALDVDGDWLAVGDPGASSLGVGGGAVHMYRRTASGWDLAQILFHPTAGFSFLATFGAALDLDGDRLAVGAPFASAVNPQGFVETGAAFVFERVGATWQLQQQLQPPHITLFAAFGSGVALDGDDLFVGAPGERYAAGGGVSRVGVVHHFSRGPQPLWSHHAQLFPAQAQVDEGFGASVALEDGVLAVGAPERRSTSFHALGRAVVFERAPSGAWVESATLDVQPQEHHRSFGEDVSVHGGEVYVTSTRFACAWRFSRAAGTWAQTERYTTEAGVTWPVVHDVRVAVHGDVVAVSDPRGATVFTRVMPARAEEGCPAEPQPPVAPSTLSAGPCLLDIHSALSLSEPALMFRVTNSRPSSSGILFYGFAPASAPLGTATRCVGGSLARAAVGFTPPTAATFSIALDLHAPPVSSGPLAIVPGTDVHVQYWFRTPGGGTHLSNSMVLSFCP